MADITIGWIGLGNMGAPMARNAAAKGFQVNAYNRTRRDLNLGPCRVVDTLKEAVGSANVVCVMVSDGSAVRDVMFGSGSVADFAQRGTLIINFSTIGVEESKQLALEAANRGLEWMDAPVSGSVGPAENGTLVVLAGGAETSFERVKPLFLTMAKEACYLGPVGSGSAMKLLVNAYLATVVEAASECLAVADKVGFGRAKMLEVLRQTATWSPILAAKEPLWNRDEYPQAFALKHMFKDLGLMSQFGQNVTAATPTLNTVMQVYLSAMANDLAEHDMAAVLVETSRMAGSDA